MINKKSNTGHTEELSRNLAWAIKVISCATCLLFSNSMRPRASQETKKRKSTRSNLHNYPRRLPTRSFVKFSPKPIILSIQSPAQTSEEISKPTVKDGGGEGQGQRDLPTALSSPAQPKPDQTSKEISKPRVKEVAEEPDLRRPGVIGGAASTVAPWGPCGGVGGGGDHSCPGNLPAPGSAPTRRAR
ncbi:hypothetical protein ElyMa_005731200 [Elysia marginata]|uniref:Uncharacterized protein n=1 Tax=Elysia marginata TaxID=1093978 RepID=A0AAV4FJP6_9GAST|nr:hypothetical protein ElyMa_005731200 [Elysia marginata]